ncbi:putative holin-like toxin [Paenibacillus contaminans]|jgi:hypothetical protein|uniref:Holin-like toxin n=1 Tax=Paenibacillus contaminans TaxID=450362 RepID=A0A329MMN7_9BACL|nr:hypothetical protein DQG23_18820 [Paenibacillus contaminans]
MSVGHLKKGGASTMDSFQTITVMLAFGMFILTLLTYIDKRK